MTETLQLTRKIAAHTTLSSWKAIPHVTFIYEANVTRVYDQFLKIKKQENLKEFSLSFNTVMIKILAEALKGQSKLNSSFYYRKLMHTFRYVTHTTIDINIPWILPNGETIPILFKDIGAKSLLTLAKEVEHVRNELIHTDIDTLMLKVIVRDTKENLKKGKLKALVRLIPILLAKTRIKNGREKNAPNGLSTERINSDGIIVSNIGPLLKGISGSFSLLEIIEPRILAIGLSAVEDKPVVGKRDTGGPEIVTGKVLPICIAFDHRAIDFNDVVPFIRKIEDILTTYEIS